MRQFHETTSLSLILSNYIKVDMAHLQVSLLQQIFKEVPWSARRFGSCGEKFLEEITIEGFQRFWGYGGKTSGAFAVVTIESLAVKVFYK
ncbi:hypothetical protein SO802_003950 [Lithocarpus litseifolius]|uniref:Uncharacterized protein n=1 Tax=Lithocarpus litseifolius TaxID=425828 RepID=A0AAW2E781_9ROSI